MRHVEWANLRADELREAAGQEEAIVILPVASVEQHGPHLPVQVDALLVGEVARRGARKARNAVVAPTVWSGLAEHHMDFGGTFTLDLDTFRALLICLCTSIARHGFSRILVLNGHGGNVAALAASAFELQDRSGAALAVATYWHLAEKRFAEILERQDGVRHAGEAETSMVLALAPELVHQQRMRGTSAPEEGLRPVGGVQRWRPIRHWSDVGVIGAPAAATPEKGELLLEAASDALAERLQDRTIWS